MNAREPEKTVIEGETLVTTRYKRISILGGAIKWWRKERSDSAGADLVINTLENYDRIILNGEILPTNKLKDI